MPLHVLVAEVHFINELLRPDPRLRVLWHKLGFEPHAPGETCAGKCREAKTSSWYPCRTSPCASRRWDLPTCSCALRSAGPQSVLYCEIFFFISCHECEPSAARMCPPPLRWWRVCVTCWRVGSTPPRTSSATPSAPSWSPGWPATPRRWPGHRGQIRPAGRAGPAGGLSGGTSRGKSWQQHAFPSAAIDPEKGTPGISSVGKAFCPARFDVYLVPVHMTRVACNRLGARPGSPGLSVSCDLVTYLTQSPLFAQSTCLARLKRPRLGA